MPIRSNRWNRRRRERQEPQAAPMNTKPIGDRTSVEAAWMAASHRADSLVYLNETAPSRVGPHLLSIRATFAQLRRQFDSALPSPGSSAFAAGQLKCQVTPKGA